MGIGSASTDNKALHELRDTLKDLNKSVKEFNRRSTYLTIAMLVLTAIMILVVIFK